MARAWSRCGGKVLYLELGGDSRPYRERVLQAGREPVEAATGLWVLRLRALPGLPWSCPDFLRRLNLRRNQRAVRRALDAAGLAPGAFVAIHYGWFWAEWAGTLGAAAEVYDCTDEHRAGRAIAGRPSREKYVWQCERRLIERVDLLVAVSAPLLEERKTFARRSLLLPNAVDPRAWAPPEGDVPSEPPELAGLPAPRLVLLGNLQPKLDLEAVEALAAEHPEWGVALIGPKERGARLPAERANLRWLGVKPQQELPRYLAHMRAGLLPLKPTFYNAASCPLKLLEYLASGLPVAASRIPASVALAQRLPGLLCLADGPGDFGQACAAALAVRDAASAKEIAAAVRDYTWARRAGAIADSLLKEPQP
jgi:glycosyltransferase involved in cell wall biosynthesis